MVERKRNASHCRYLAALTIVPVRLAHAWPALITSFADDYFLAAPESSPLVHQNRELPHYARLLRVEKLLSPYPQAIE
jgi:hypothetical protein